MVVVLFGLAVLSLVTASVAAMLVQTDECQLARKLLHEIAELRGELRSLRAEVLHSNAPSLPTQVGIEQKIEQT